LCIEAELKKSSDQASNTRETVYLENINSKKNIMKKILVVLFLCLSGAAIDAQVLTFKPTTGDAELDGFLKDIDTKAKKDIAVFKERVAANYNLVKSDVEQAVKVLPPGDVFMAAQVASTTNKPFPTVVETYEKNKDKGWGEIAKEMGIKPGSPEFHEMKKALKANGKKGKGKDKAKGKEEEKGKGKKK
jgi:hypothetical protein